jgi:hypothetical protein
MMYVSAKQKAVSLNLHRYNSERLAVLWGFDELWLHVNIDNPVGLYKFPKP